MQNVWKINSAALKGKNKEALPAQIWGDASLPEALRELGREGRQGQGVSTATGAAATGAAAT